MYNNDNYFFSFQHASAMTVSLFCALNIGAFTESCAVVYAVMNDFLSVDSYEDKTCRNSSQCCQERITYTDILVKSKGCERTFYNNTCAEWKIKEICCSAGMLSLTIRQGGRVV